MEDQENNTSNLRLKSWGPNWDLSSVDADCLTIITYGKFTKAPLIIESTIPCNTVTGALPELQIEESVYTSTMNVLGVLRREGYNADFELTPGEHADTLAYIALIEEKLKPGLLNNLWVDTNNYINVTRPAYAKMVGFLRSYWDLPQLRNTTEIDLQYRTVGTVEERQNDLYDNAKTCLSKLSARLGDRNYFFGDSPTTLDAVAYGHLAVISKAPFTSSTLQNHFHSLDNLGKYCARVSHHFFSNNDAGPSYRAETIGSNVQTGSDVSDRLSKYSQISSVIVAIAAMTVYAVTMGIFSSGKRKRGGSARYELAEVDDSIE